MSYPPGVSKGGVQKFNGHLYWFSWQDNDANVKNAKWDWFNARNYCRYTAGLQGGSHIR